MADQLTKKWEALEALELMRPNYPLEGDPYQKHYLRVRDYILNSTGKPMDNTNLLTKKRK